MSPLLANAYLHAFDQWITREWGEKKTKRAYSNQVKKIRALKNSRKLKLAYLVRYADDWVLITDTKNHAVKWDSKISRYLHTSLKLKLSKDRSLITNVRKKSIHFLGFCFKVVKGKSRTGDITRTKPNLDKLKR